MGIAETAGAVMPPLAVIGGTFDPVHDGHLWLARRAAACFGAVVRLIPNGAPPHRAAACASWRERVAMCRLAAAGLRRVEVGEDEPPGKARYTVDTLRKLKSEQPARRLLLIVGGDAFAAFDRWRQPQVLLTLAHIVVARRAGFAAAPDRRRRINKKQLSEGAGGVYFWPCRAPDIAARDIRAALAAGRRAAALPPQVAAYARQHRLYAAARHDDRRA